MDENGQANVNLKIRKSFDEKGENVGEKITPKIARDAKKTMSNLKAHAAKDPFSKSFRGSKK